jgi:heme exporter protein CcmD
MDFSANHVGFVVAAYALSAVVLVAVIVAVIIRDRKLAHKEDEQDGR